MRTNDPILSMARADSDRLLSTKYDFEIQIERWMMQRAWNAWFYTKKRITRLFLTCGLLWGPVVLDLERGRFEAVSFVCLGIVALAGMIHGGAYFSGLHRAQVKWAGIVGGKVRYTLTDDTIAAASSLGSIALAWSAIAEVRRYQNLILIGLYGAAYSTIPAAQIPTEALDFLVDRASAGGAIITDL